MLFARSNIRVDDALGPAALASHVAPAPTLLAPAPILRRPALEHRRRIATITIATITVATITGVDGANVARAFFAHDAARKTTASPSARRYIHIRVTNHQLTKLWRKAAPHASKLELPIMAEAPEKPRSRRHRRVGAIRAAPDFRRGRAALELG